ncbi:MAG: ECF transporter S component [Clostridium sp.]|uniref:CD3073 family putative ECF transporter S component n=1 Tax=Clostridium sp. TaxID=1506 RepID=UPI002FC6FA75
MQTNKTKILIFSGLAIAMNIVLGQVAGSLKLPIYLDVIGTIFIAAYYGPMYGAVVGGLTNLLWGVLMNPKNIPFMLVSIAVGIIVGLISKRHGFTLKTSIITGLILGVVCPLIGTPIGVLVYKGITGTGLDFVFLWLQTTGQNIFVSSFITKLGTNLLDKVLCCFIVYMIIKQMPTNMKPGHTVNDNLSA